MPGDTATISLDHALRALADGNRRALLGAVRSAPLAVGDLATAVGLSQQSTSHHLRVLRTAGLVTESREGVRHLFAVNDDGFDAVRSYLDEFWPARLAALRTAVESGRSVQSSSAAESSTAVHTSRGAADA